MRQKYKMEVLKSSFSNKIKKLSSQLDGYFTEVNDLYKSIIKQIEKSAAQIKSISNNYGLSQLEQEVYQKLKQMKFTELTGDSINKVSTELMQDNKQYQIRIIEKEKKKIENQTTILVQMLERLNKLKENNKYNTLINQSQKSQKQFKLDSRITQDVGTLLSFFPNKKIDRMDLIYRASENNFQASQFHNKCGGKKHTLIILKTEFGKVIGGYTLIPWDKSKSNYQTDSSMQSFIFSVTNKHKLQLIKEMQQYAITQQQQKIIQQLIRSFNNSKCFIIQIEF